MLRSPSPSDSPMKSRHPPEASVWIPCSWTKDLVVSENSLDLAMQALAGLSDGQSPGRNISHVAELKERIDRQIIVRKDRSSGSRVEIQS